MTTQIPPSLPEPRRRDHWQHVGFSSRHTAERTYTRPYDGASMCGSCGREVELTPEWHRYWQREADRQEPLRQAAIAALREAQS
jgi:hypothetical protein